MARQSSTSSHVSSDDHHKQPHKVQRQHVVGHSRMQRNTSLGKNLNKLNKLTQAPAGDGNTAKHHNRSRSGDSSSLPSSPRRPGHMKRNASSGGIVRAVNHGHAQVNVKRNLSSGHLQRQASSKNALKSSKNETASARKSHAHASKARRQSDDDDDHPTVHFDIGNEEGHDDAWTEESASQSPTTTRSNTRSNSLILDPQKATEMMAGDAKQIGKAPTTATTEDRTHPPPNAMRQTLPDRTVNQRHTNGGNSHHHSRLPDADMITSRLLQRNSSHNPPPQMSSIAATVVSNTHDARTLSQSASSTLVDTPGRDLVSRFMDGDGSAGTPKGSSFLPSRASPQSGGDFDKAKRNKSMPNVAGADSPSKTPRRSGASTPTDLPPSRTQQKLMLQRASSNIEPQKGVPAVIPRLNYPTLVTSAMAQAVNGEGRLDPRLQQQLNHVSVEYRVVRRYRNPLADAIARIEQIPGTPRKRRMPRSTETNGFVNVHGSSSLSTSLNEETDGSGIRRDEGEGEGRQSFESDHGRTRNEAEEICRRLWESTEISEGD